MSELRESLPSKVPESGLGKSWHALQVRLRRQLSSAIWFAIDGFIACLPHYFTVRVLVTYVTAQRQCIRRLESGDPMPEFNASCDDVSALGAPTANAWKAEPEQANGPEMIPPKVFCSEIREEAPQSSDSRRVESEPAASLPDPVQPDETKTPALKGVKILLLDSKETDRRSLKLMLTGQGADVEEADGALEALLALAQAVEKGDPFSIALIDGRLSRVTGLDAARRILDQEWGAELPIVLLTGGLCADDLEDLGEVSVQCFDGPPTDSMALVAKLTTALAGRPRRCPAPAATPRVRRVLIVDDNAINLFLARDFLKNLPGFEVETAEGGKAGLARALAKHFDIILMDMQMPDMDGQTVTREIRRHELASGLKPIPILAFTAHSAAEDLESALAAGCNGHIIKPARKGRLISTVLSFLGQDEGESSSAQQAVPAASKRDSSAAKIRAEGNDRFREHMGGYLLKLAESLTKAEAALAEQDFKTVREIVHKWIGPSASLGIPELSDEGGLVQDAARGEQAQLVRKQLGQTREYATRLEIIYANGDAVTAPLGMPVL